MSDREIAEKLWCLLDDIDTATDIFKPDNNNKFVQYVYKKIGERFKYLKSDGYNLYTKEEYRDKIINNIEMVQDIESESHIR